MLAMSESKLDETKCLYLDCNSIFERPVTLTCCGESICQHHVEDLSINDDKSIIKCPFCSNVYELPKNGLPINKTIQRLVNMNLSASHRAAKNNLNYLNDEIQKLESLLNNPDEFIRGYFKEIKEKIRDKRKSMIVYYQNLLKQLDDAENECLSSVLNASRNEEELVQVSLQRQNWLNEVKKAVMEEEQWIKMNEEINDSITQIKNKIERVQSELLCNNTYEFNDHYCRLNNMEDLYGKIVVNGVSVLENDCTSSDSVDRLNLVSNESVLNMLLKRSLRFPTLNQEPEVVPLWNANTGALSVDLAIFNATSVDASYQMNGLEWSKQEKFHDEFILSNFNPDFAVRSVYRFKNIIKMLNFFRR